MNTLTVESETYGSWPNFFVEGPLNFYGQAQCIHLHTLLTSDEERYRKWRESIPRDVLEAVLKMPEGRGDLLLLAQMMPDRFVELVRRAPAWLAVAASYWMYEGRPTPPSDAEKLDFYAWFYVAPKHRALSRVGFGTRATVKILGKLPPGSCVTYNIIELRDLLADASATRMLSHLPRVNGPVLDLLGRENVKSDFQLLRLASEQPFDGGERLTGVLNHIEEWRERLQAEDPCWPYRGTIRSWQTLRRIRTRLQSSFESDPFTFAPASRAFPSPPLAVVASELPRGLSLEPIDSPEKLEEESSWMSNCAVTYLELLCRRSDLYFYRVLKPERATLLLLRGVDDRWWITELAGPCNSTIPQEVWVLVEAWLKRAQKVSSRDDTDKIV